MECLSSTTEATSSRHTRKTVHSWRGEQHMAELSRSLVCTIWSQSIHTISKFLLMPRRIGHPLQAMGGHLAHYGRDITIAQNGVIRFWDEFGYLSPEWNSLHLVSCISDARGLWKPCPLFSYDLCLTWMALPFWLSSVGKFALVPVFSQGTMIYSSTSMRLLNRNRRLPWGH